MHSSAAALAARLHESWRASRRQPADGTVPPPREANGSVDIADQDFANLPPTWQIENLAAAASALVAVDTSGSLEEAAAKVHRDWLARNGEWATPEQKLPYSELSEPEKEKDRAVARIAAAAAGVILT